MDINTARHTLDAVIDAGVQAIVYAQVQPVRGQRDALLKWIFAVRNASCMADDTAALARIRELVREFEEDR
jgi:D-serine deaminase-like pyridoxal phosphate-dependent protein